MYAGPWHHCADCAYYKRAFKFSSDHTKGCSANASRGAHDRPRGFNAIGRSAHRGHDSMRIATHPHGRACRGGARRTHPHGRACLGNACGPSRHWFLRTIGRYSTRFLSEVGALMKNKSRRTLAHNCHHEAMLLAHCEAAPWCEWESLRESAVGAISALRISPFSGQPGIKPWATNRTRGATDPGKLWHPVKD